jgi:hypothetical protein
MKTNDTNISCSLSTDGQRQHKILIGNNQCACNSAPEQRTSMALGSKFKSYFGRLFTLCVICCATPYVLVTLGVMSVSTGAYFGRWVEASVVFGALTAIAYFSWRHFQQR